MALSSVVVFYLERIPYVCFVLMTISTVRVFYRSTATVASYKYSILQYSLCGDRAFTFRCGGCIASKEDFILWI